MIVNFKNDKVLELLQASENEVLWAMRGSIFIFGVTAATIAILTNSIMTLVILSTDFIFVLTWPQVRHGFYYIGHLKGITF